MAYNGFGEMAEEVVVCICDVTDVATLSSNVGYDASPAVYVYAPCTSIL